VVGAIRMAADLERVGDLAKNIAKRVGAVGQTATPRNLSHSIDAMAGLVLTQVNGVIDHYVARDPEALKTLRAEDEKIDIQYTSVFRELLTYMMEDPRNITACTHLLFCAKNLERIGDHVTNIAENAYYVMTGQLLPAHRPKVDETAAMSAA
jgi:phosphate transport system protein